MPEQVRILFVDDEANILRAITRVFLDDTYEILTASSGNEALEILSCCSPVQVVVSDFRMPQMNGVELLRKIRKQWPETVRLVISGYADTAAIISAINDGQIYRFIPKPWDDTDLRMAIATAVEQYRRQRKEKLYAESILKKIDDLEKENSFLVRCITTNQQKSVPALRKGTLMENRILLIDDEPNILAAIIRILMDEPYEILKACSGERGLEILAEMPCKVVISDERMPGMGGAEFLSRVKELYPATIRIILTGYASIDAAMKAVNDGEIYRFFMKPWDDMDLRLAIRGAIEKYDLQIENQRLLGVVQKQADELQTIESRFPGITQIEKDVDGSIFVPEMSDDEMDELLKNCAVNLVEDDNH